MDKLNLASGRAYFVSNQNNIRYLTGFPGSGLPEQETFVLLTEKICILYTSSLYSEYAVNLALIKKWINFGKGRIPFRTISTSLGNPFLRKLKIDCRKYGIRKISYEPDDLTADEYIRLRKCLSGIKLIPSRNRFNEMRKFKDHTEIKNIRKAAKITDVCYGYILKKMKAGISESKLAVKIESYIRNRGGQPAFPPIVAFGPHTSQPHYLPDKTPLKSGDPVLIDLGARINGYASDMTRVVNFGKPKKGILKAYQTVLKAQTAVIEALSRTSGHAYLKRKSAYSGASLDKMAKSVIRKAGYIPYPHGLGHGVGLSIHEKPKLSIRNDMLIKPGMVFTVEPAIYIPGQFGVRIEDTVFLSEDGLEILTKSPKIMMF